MPGRPYILSEVTWKVVRDTDYQVAVLPWGATEAHNYHLPYGTDVLQNDYIACESARKAWEEGARTIVLPTIPFGVNTGQLDIPLDINMNPSTQVFVLRDVVDSLARHDIKKIVVLNGHGGNDFRQMIRELLVDFDVFLGVVDWYRILDLTIYFDEPGDHAGEMETSNMMQLHPELTLALDQAGSGAAKRFVVKGLREGWAWTQREWSRVTADTGVGNPALATPEKARRFLTDLTDEIGSFLVELAGCDLEELYGEEV